MVVVVVLALTPELAGPARRLAIGLDERQSSTVLDSPVIGQPEAERVAEGGSFREIDDESIPQPRVTQLPGSLPAPAHRLDKGELQQLPRVQHDRVESRPERPQRRGNHPVETRAVPVEAAQLDPLVDQVVVMGAAVAVVEHPLRVGLGNERRRYEQGETDEQSHGFDQDGG